MAIQLGQRITYGDLIAGIYEKIISVCQNIDGYRSDASLRPGHSYSRNVNSDPSNPQSAGVTVTATMVSSGYLNSVSSGTVRDQLNSFLSSRGLAGKAGQYVSSRGMVNFYANLAAFLSAKLIRVANSYTGASAIYYYASGSVDSIPNAPNAVGIDPSTVQSEVDGLVRNVANDWYMYVTRYSYSMACCSSSSCSSSTSCCSSCSCSSSSSWFIAFMRL